MNLPKGFEIYKRVHTGRNRLEGVVSIDATGTLGIPRDVREMLGRPDRVEILFDRDRKVLALRPAESVSSYKLRRPTKTGRTTLFAQAALDHYEIDYSEITHLVPWMEDDLLCIDVSSLIEVAW